MIKKYFKSLVSKLVDFVFMKRKRRARLTHLIALMSGRQNYFTGSIESSFWYGGVENSIKFLIDHVNNINQTIKNFAPVVILMSIFIAIATLLLIGIK